MHYAPPSEAPTTLSAFQAKYVIGFKVPMMTNIMQVKKRQAL